MQNTMTKEEMIREFTDQYTGSLFYFCLRKTGNSYEAEDLASDIALNVLTSLSRGNIPANFSAWVWQIARNRYSVWADKKHRRMDAQSGCDIRDYEIEDETADIEARWIHNEDMKALRRELAFISSDYRNVVVSYYLENKSVKEIAFTLHLPEGTVMSKLHRARKILKEGMSMSREFGTMSYKPEDIHYVLNGSFGTMNEPEIHMSHLVCKNILVAAYRTPSTAEELALELGVALPYMEDELRILTEATLLRKQGNRYETNFMIISAKAQDKVNTHRMRITGGLAAAIIDALEYRVKCCNENGVRWQGGYQPYEDMKWALLTDLTDNAYWRTITSINPVRNEPNDWLPDRPNGGKWDILGFETYLNENEPKFVGMNGCPGLENGTDFYQYKYQYKDIWAKTPRFLNKEEGKTLEAIVKGTDFDPALADKLLEYGYLVKDENGYRPTFLVLYGTMNSHLTEAQKIEFDAKMEKAKSIALDFYLFCRETVLSEVPEFFRNDTYRIEYTCENLFMLRGAVLEEALRKGYISYAENDECRMLGAVMTV